MPLLAVCALAAALPACAASVTEVAPGVHFRQGDLARGQANGGYIVSEDHVIAIEAPSPEASAEMLGEIRKITDKPLRFLILTHGHWDHDGGAGVFLEKGVTLICHENLRQRYLKEKKPGNIVGATDRHTLTSGKRVMEFFTLGTCHSTTDLFVYLPAEGILFTGDTAVNAPALWMGECDVRGWLDGLDRLGELKPKVVCPGHGPAGGHEVLDLTRAYLLSLRDQVAGQVCQGRTLEATLKQLAAPHREDYGRDYLIAVRHRERFATDDRAFADHVKAAYKQLTAEPSKPPPDNTPRALALIGDHYHPPELLRPPLESALKSIRMPIEFVYDVTKVTASNLAGFQLLIVARDGLNWPDPKAKWGEWWMTPEQERALIEFVQAGGGLLALHGATALKPWGKKAEAAEILRVLGSDYNGHGAPDEKFSVRVVRPDHPVTRGVSSYMASDERHAPILHARDITVLLEARSGDSTSASGYVRTEGKGRICYLANGHNRAVLELPPVQRLIANAARWCCGLEP